jgi:flagellin
VGLRVHENVVARSIHAVLANRTERLGRSITELSSGYRINRSRDDAAGQAIAEKFGGQVRGLNQAPGNAQDGLNLVRTAESSMGQVHEILQRMRELAVQAANDTLTESDRGHVTDELLAMSGEITRIGEAAEYNTKKLLDGSLASSGLTLQVGANAGEVFTIRLDTLSASNLGVLSTQLSVDNSANAASTLARLDDAIDRLSRFRGSAGATVNRLEHAISDLGVMGSRMAASQSQILDLDMAKATTRLATNQILTQSGTAMLAQANAQPQSVLALLR